MKRISFLTLLATTCVLALPSALTAAPKKLLVITQSKGFVHNPVKRTAPDQLCLVEQTLQDLGTKTGVFTTDNSQDAIASLTRENLAKYDGVLFYTTGILLPEGDPREALTDFIKQGKAFIGTHSASDTFHGGKDAYMGYVKMINGSFAGHPWTSGTTCSFVSHDPNHPTVKMLGSEFQWKDEIYQYNNYDPAAVRVLFSLDMSKTNPKMPYLVPVCWVREYGQGRLFYTNLGHNDATWKDAKFHEHLVAGIRWAMKLEDGSATPNPEAQMEQYIRSVAATAADAAKKDWQPAAQKGIAKAKKNPQWYAKLQADVEAWRKLPTLDPKKATPEEVKSANDKRAQGLAALLASLEE